MHENIRSIRVFIAAQPLIRWGLERLIQSTHPSYELTGAATDVEEAMPMLQRQPADVVLLVMDEMPTERLADFCASCGAKVLLVTNSVDLPWLDSAVLAGVRGVLRTVDSPEALLKAIDKVNEGELWIDRGATSRIFIQMARQKASEPQDPDRSKIATLTVRERQTIAALASDASAPGKVIAHRLCISEHTLRNHLTSIYSKLGLSNRLDLYAFATRHSMQDLR